MVANFHLFHKNFYFFLPIDNFEILFQCSDMPSHPASQIVAVFTMKQRLNFVFQKKTLQYIWALYEIRRLRVKIEMC